MYNSEILISWLNDFTFCPLSIYFHNIQGECIKEFKSNHQVIGLNSHKLIDNAEYSTKKNILQGIDIFCEKYNLIGKIDVYDKDKKTLIERKTKIQNVYDGHIFQCYAQYFSLIEMGYDVKCIKLYSYSTNKFFDIELPIHNESKLKEFEILLNDIKNFDINNFKQFNENKCKNCIYSDICNRGI